MTFYACCEYAVKAHNVLTAVILTKRALRFTQNTSSRLVTAVQRWGGQTESEPWVLLDPDSVDGACGEDEAFPTAVQQQEAADDDDGDDIGGRAMEVTVGDDEFPTGDVRNAPSSSPAPCSEVQSDDAGGFSRDNKSRKSEWQRQHQSSLRPTALSPWGGAQPVTLSPPELLGQDRQVAPL